MQNTLSQILAALTPQQPQLQQSSNYQQHQLPPISDSYSQSSIGQPSFSLPTTLNQHQYPLPSLGLPAMQQSQEAPSPNTQAWMAMSIPALTTSPNPSTTSPSSAAFERGLRGTTSSSRTDWPAGRTDLSSTSADTPSTMFSHWTSSRDGSNPGGGGQQDDRGVVVASGSNGSTGIRFQAGGGGDAGVVQGSPERERQSKRSWERSGREGREGGGRGEKSFPPLPGFAPPPTHK